MAKTVCTILGIAFLLIGLIGFFAHSFLGTHLSMAHNVVHLVSGAAALFIGLRGSLGSARTFCIVFGLVYALLGIAGFVAGNEGTPGVPGPADAKLLKVLPGVLELGTMDHVIHILLGTIFLIGGLMTRGERTTHG